jgi:hypothetical protein
MAPWISVLVSIPCHLEPYVRFSLIRLSDNLLPTAYEVMACIFLLGRSIPNQNVFDGDPVYTSTPTIPTHFSPGPPQYIGPQYAVIERMKPPVSAPLGRQV